MKQPVVKRWNVIETTTIMRRCYVNAVTREEAKAEGLKSMENPDGTFTTRQEVEVHATPTMYGWPNP